MKAHTLLFIFLILLLSSSIEASELSVVSLEFSSTVSTGTTYYVSTTGDDSSDGLSEATPWLTLANAGSTLQPEDELIVEDYTIALVGADTGTTSLRLIISSLTLTSSDTEIPVWETAIGIASVTVDGTGGNVSVSFGGATDSADGSNIIYNIYYAPSSFWDDDWSLNNVIMASSSPFTMPGLSNDVEFTFGVRVSDQSGNEETNIITLTATPIWDEPPVIDDSMIAVGYEEINPELITEQGDQAEEESITIMAISLYCNAVEHGNSLRRPTTAIVLQGRFYVLSGALIANWLPPDPGSAGNLTIAGIDSDGDCVRDDIERYIAQALPGDAQKKARRYAFEYAKWRGQFLKDSLNSEDAMEISRNLYKNGECVKQILGNDQTADEIIDRVFSKFHNTYPRSYRYIDHNAFLGGWTTREDIVVSCP